MAEPDPSTSTASSSSAIHREFSSNAASSSSASQVREEEDHRDRDQLQHRFPHPELEHPQFVIPYQGNPNLSAFDDASVIRDDTWSCVIVLLTFWFFVSMTLILGVYGSVNLRLGPNCSLLLQPSPIFVQYMKVEELNGSGPGPVLYGFSKTPPVDTVTTWSETRSVSVKIDSHQEWIYVLNKGSQINISYSVNSPNYSIFLIIAEGSDGLAQWLEEPTYPNTTLSWNLIHGSGMITQDISRSSTYYVAVGNLNTEEVEVELNLELKAYIHNTTEAYYKCTFPDGLCSLSILFPNGNVGVLTSPSTEQESNFIYQSGWFICLKICARGTVMLFKSLIIMISPNLLNYTPCPWFCNGDIGKNIDEWYFKLSYGPRWITYIVGIGGMTLLMLLAFNFLNKFQCNREDGRNIQFGEMGSARVPLLPHKDDDLSSWGSSYDSVSDEDGIEDLLVLGSLEGVSLGDGENSNNTRRLCAICFDAPRDCFFLPCGHCVACFECGTRIVEATGTCPVCRRHMKKVRKIFTV